MELRDYIEAGIAKEGTAAALAIFLDQDATALRNAKAHRRGLPVYACIELARLIEAEPMAVIAASELVTEKREERKAVFLPFAQMGRLAHPMNAAIATVSIALADWTDSVLTATRDLLL